MNSQKEFITSFKSAQLHNNFILDLNPLTKLNLIVSIALAGIFMSDIWSRLALIIFCFIVTACAGQAAFGKFISLYSKIGSLVFVLLTVINTVFRPGETLYWEWWVIGITKEGFLYGIVMAFLVTSVCASILTFYATTPAKDFMYAIETLGVPRSASYIILASAQSVTDLGKSAQIIMESQNARGVETTGSLPIRCKALIPILFPLLLGAISSTEEKAVAMETKAFGAKVHATHIYELRKTRLWEKLFCVAVDVAVLAAIVWRFMG